MNESTIKFTVPSDDKENMHRILRAVFDALTERDTIPSIKLWATCSPKIPRISPTTTMPAP